MNFYGFMNIELKAILSSTFPFIPQKATFRAKSFALKVLDTIPDLRLTFRKPDSIIGPDYYIPSKIKNGVRLIGIPFIYSRWLPMLIIFPNCL